MERNPWELSTYTFALLFCAPFCTKFNGELLEPIFIFGGAYSTPLWMQSDRLLPAHP